MNNYKKQQPYQSLKYKKKQIKRHFHFILNLSIIFYNHGYINISFLASKRLSVLPKKKKKWKMKQKFWEIGEVNQSQNQVY